ncbi:MAG: MaoC family dehydratase [Archaeoglobales archaeon]|nr:MaoC family dehydratase [Archaeoglobales archaeon]
MMELEEVYRKLGGEVKKFEKFSGQLDVGYEITYEKRITEADVYLFGLISGDFNPIHFEEEFAKKTRFGGRVAQGMLTTSLVSAAVARIPGIVVLLETYFKYTAPVKIGDLVRIQGTVVEKEKNRYKLNIKCAVEDRLVAEGWVKILIW